MALTPQQTEQFGRIIEERRRALIDEYREDLARMQRDRFGEIAGDTHDAGDESVALLIAELARADTQRDLGELRALEVARVRMLDGSYGVCADCGSEIGYERLRAEPTALRCIGCQRLHEKTFAGPAGAKL